MDPSSLTALGLSPFFLQQLDLAAGEAGRVARVTAVHRGQIEVLGPAGTMRVPPFRPDLDPVDQATVGDWVVLSRSEGRPPERLLDRQSLFKRRAAGAESRVQLIAANVDTVFITSSCNLDFNPARLERYLAVVHEAGALPVIVLTKADLAADPDDFRTRAQAVARGALVETVNALWGADVARLAQWAGPGETVAFMGSSGVGKSTLINTLRGNAEQVTRAIREDDAHGRHTTTARGLFRLASGGWLIDTPGMREIQLAEAAEGIDAAFDDVTTLAAGCRFNDCRHEGEPGCAVAAAVADGTLDPARVTRWRKLRREEARNTASLAERRAFFRERGKLYRKIQGEKDARRDRDG
ncbi:MAG: ribosome small subunit-dependent GTPase A [Azospirillaceae bacterium]